MEIVGYYHDKEALILLPESVNRVSQGDRKTRGKCWRCDKAGHYAKECRVSRDHKCIKCGKVGHLELCCYSTSQRGRVVNRCGACGRGKSQGHGGQTQRDYVQQLGEEAEKQGSNNDFYVFSADDANKGNVLKLKIEDKIIYFIIDSGASCNLISEQIFNQIAGGKVDLSACDKKVFAYAATKPIELKGKCSLNVCVPQTQKSLLLDFYVTSGKAPTLLGRKASKMLGLLKVGVLLQVTENRRAALKAKFPKVFSGLGKLKGYQLKFHIDEKVQPVAQPVRRIPFSRRAKVEQKIEELVQLDVLEKAKGPTSWVNPLVAVEKPNGNIRICLDMRQANQAILREKHPVSTVEETLQEISRVKVFTKLDLNMSFYQIKLHPDSRDISTFAAPNGLYRYKCLLFGINIVTEKFQQIIWQVIKDCPGAYNIHDDLRVVGANDKEHNENLERVMRKLEEHGLTLNYKKCEVGVSSMVYMGDVLSGEGLKISDRRVEAIVKSPPPRNQSEVRSFLGSTQFCAKFIPNFASISSPLWDLTKKGAK